MATQLKTDEELRMWAMDHVCKWVCIAQERGQLKAFPKAQEIEEQAKALVRFVREGTMEEPMSEKGTCEVKTW